MWGFAGALGLCLWGFRGVVITLTTLEALRVQIKVVFVRNVARFCCYSPYVRKTSVQGCCAVRWHFPGPVVAPQDTLVVYVSPAVCVCVFVTAVYRTTH